ncbi:M48 family metallopeptidase [Roseomonas sp. E05]|uniref:M48 family metallopeptidase n=1 Tax=Roseomonas sp. E05 TaxID=3046310 RepID=UPI0024B9CD10|nr:M48 family metallopeptidase [Roseomonas sp. E05]MDJ0386718.1 M48 family metallopeptidase [Roseomonas sp. E05]
MTPPPEATERILLRATPGTPSLRCPLRWRVSSRARQVSLRIDPVRGEAVITLPHGAGRRIGLALLRRHAGWVAARLQALPPPLRFAPGAAVPVGDIPHLVHHEAAHPGPALLREGRILVGGAEEALPRRVLALLRAEAAQRIAPRAWRHAANLGVTPQAIRLKDPRSRWASCAVDGTLAFSWRLVMAPPWVLDYVVAHEVAHLREMNHSPRFWANLARLTPHRTAAHGWLRQHGPRLLRVG